jgi:hypothetical protein
MQHKGQSRGLASGGSKKIGSCEIACERATKGSGHIDENGNPLPCLDTVEKFRENADGQEQQLRLSDRKHEA